MAKTTLSSLFTYQILNKEHTSINKYVATITQQLVNASLHIAIVKKNIYIVIIIII